MPVLNCRLASCGKEFHVPLSWVGKRVYHSATCREAAKEEHKLQNTRICQYEPCGKPFVVPPSRIRRGYGDKFHSSRCAGLVKRVPLAERFANFVPPAVDDLCQEWLGSRHEHGYGLIWRDGGLALAHRIAYELAYGPIPPGAHILHECDNPPCVRVGPGHLHLGDHVTNMQERDARGRVAKGDASGQRRHPERYPRGTQVITAKLTEAEVSIIRAAQASGISQTALAKQFGVNQSAISDIVRRHTWKHVPYGT